MKDCLIKDGWVSTIDLEDAFYHLKAREKDRKYLRFMIGDRIYEFTSLPMGLTSSPRLFSELVRFLAGIFRKSGIINVIYLDDLLIVADTQEKCRTQTLEVVCTLKKLGFMINEKKSVTEPSQKVLFLGFWWDMVNWMVSLSEERHAKTIQVMSNLIRSPVTTNRGIAKFIGMAECLHSSSSGQSSLQVNPMGTPGSNETRQGLGQISSPLLSGP